MDREPDLRALRALTLIAAEESISAASARLGMSQQAVSLRIRGLEAALNVQLLTRSARGSHLTPTGELVVGWAAPMLAAVDDFSAASASLRAQRIRTLRIAASLTIAEHLLPEWVARWRIALADGDRHHDAGRDEDRPVAHLTAANSTAVIESVRAGTVDLGFIETPRVPDDLGSVTIGRDTIELVVPRDHPWEGPGRVNPAELSQTGLVLREPGSGTRQALEDALEGAGLPLSAEPAAVIPTTLGVRSAIMAGRAPGALSALAVAEDLRAGRLARVRIDGIRIERPLTAVWLGRAPGPAARTLLDSIAAAQRNEPVQRD